MSRFALSLFTFSILLACGAAHAGPKEDANLLPAKTSCVLQVDLDGLRKTQLFKTLVASNPMYPAFVGQFMMRTGVDLAAVKTVTVGLIDDNQGDGMFMLIDAPLNLATPSLSAPNVKKRSVRGSTYYVVGGREGALAEFKGRTLLGPEPRIRDILSSKTTLSKRLRKASEGRQAPAQFWVFGQPPKARVDGANDFDWINASLDLATGLKLNANAEGKPETIATLVQQFQAQKQALAANPMLAMGLGGVVTKLNMTGKGKALTVSLNLNQAEFNQLQMLFQTMLQAQAAAAAQGGAGAPGIPGMPPAMPGMPGMPAPSPSQPAIPPGRTIKPPVTR